MTLKTKSGEKTTVRAVVFCATMILSGVFAFVLTPKAAVSGNAPDLAKMLPSEFAGWHVLPGVHLVTAQAPDALEHELYSNMVGQAYVDANQHVVMLLLAYGPSQTDRLQLHRPEICYVANGFRVSGITQGDIALANGRDVPVRRLVATREGRVEYITYWMRIGNQVVNSVLRRQLLKVEYGLAGSVPDGLLVRTSVVGSSPREAYEIQAKFVQALSQVSPQLRQQITGRS